MRKADAPKQEVPDQRREEHAILVVNDILASLHRLVPIISLSHVIASSDAIHSSSLLSPDRLEERRLLPSNRNLRAVFEERKGDWATGGVGMTGSGGRVWLGFGLGLGFV